MSNADAEVLSALQAMFSRWLTHAQEPTRSKVQQRLAQGWRPTAVYQVTNGVPQLELRVQDPGGLRFVCLRNMRPGKGESKL
jgi:hypothetical protein